MGWAQSRKLSLSFLHLSFICFASICLLLMFSHIIFVPLFKLHFIPGGQGAPGVNEGCEHELAVAVIIVIIPLKTSLVEVWLCVICSAVLTVSLLNVGNGMKVEWKCGKWNEVQCFARWLAPKGAALANEVLACCGAKCLRLQDWDLLLKWIRCSGLTALLCNGRNCMLKKPIQTLQCSMKSQCFLF